MSFEYSTLARLSEAEIRSLKAAIPNDRYLLLADPPGNSLRLRFAGHPPRAHWPEDIVIEFASRIAIVIHSGTQTERTDFVRYVEAHLAEIGRDCSFEEE